MFMGIERDPSALNAPSLKLIIFVGLVLGLKLDTSAKLFVIDVPSLNTVPME